MTEFTIQNVWLIKGEQSADDLEEKLKNSCEQHGLNFQGTIEFQLTDTSALNGDDLYLFSVSDQNLKQFLNRAEELTIGLLPHPEAALTQKRFQIANSFDKAFEAIIQCEHPRVVDNLYCNDTLILSSVLAGDLEAMQPALKSHKSIFSRIVYLWHLIMHMIRGKLFEVGFTTEKESQLQTAALGLCVVYQPEDNTFSKSVLANSEETEPNLNTIIFAPRSTSEILHFIFTRLLSFRKKERYLTNYLGHIKTEMLDINFVKPIQVHLDSEEQEVNSLKCEVKPTSIGLLHQGLPAERLSEPKESFRVKTLARGELASSLVSRPLPWIYHIDQDEVKETFVSLKESAKFTQVYFILMALSSLLATVGLFANSAPVIIGAMILAPLMAPIISLSMGVLRQEADLVLTSAKTLLYGVFLTLIGAMFFTWFMPLQSLNSEISARLSPNLLDLGVAIVSGIAGAYASAKSEVAKSLAGVAIAVALVPPLVVAGIGAGWWDWHVFSGAILLFLTNLFGIILAAAATFLLLGFSPFHLAKRGLALSLLIVLIVSVPLSWAFYSMVQEQRMVSALEGQTIASNGTETKLRSVQIRRGDPIKVSLTLVANRNLDTEDIDRIKKEIEQRLEQKVQLEASLSLLR